jgi:hypothetical protein
MTQKSLSAIKEELEIAFVQAHSNSSITAKASIQRALKLLEEYRSQLKEKEDVEKLAEEDLDKIVYVPVDEADAESANYNTEIALKIKWIPSGNGWLKPITIRKVLNL